MNHEVKNAWVAALRSGDYAQGRASLALTREDGVTEYCCLGVLCELAVAEGVVEATRPTSHGTHRYGAPGAGAYLPDEVIAWSGVRDRDPRVQLARYNRSRALSTLNDEGTSFAKIADLVAEQL